MSSAALLLLVLSLAGCKGIPTGEERVVRENLETVDRLFHPDEPKPDVSSLTPDTPLEGFLRFALLNQPAVAASYYDWASSVEQITRSRSLPDPQFGFQSDITDMVKMLMFGISQQFPGPGKLKARAAVASAQSEGRYFDFESAVQKTAFELKRSFYELYFLDENIRITRENLELLNSLEEIARAQNVAGKVTLQDVLRARIALDQVATGLENLEDSRRPLMAAFKAALGLTHEQRDPPAPVHLSSTRLDQSESQLLDTAFENNPSLAALEAQIRATQADIALAYKQNVPDFSVGVMADVKSSPVMIRPLLGMTLPIWRDKVAAGIAQAQAMELAARSRLDVEQIALTVTVAEKTFAYREITRNLELLRDRLIPQAALSVEIARAGYLGGTISFFNLIDAQREQLAFQLSEVGARTRREIVLADLALLVAGLPPDGAPVLPRNNNLHPTLTR